MSERVNDVENGLKQTNGPPDAVRSAVEEVSKQLVTARRQLAYRHPGKSEDSAAEESPRRRADIDCDAQRTGDGVDVGADGGADDPDAGARGELMKAVEGVNALITQAMPRLYRALAENNLLLIPIEPVKAITISSLEK